MRVILKQSVNQEAEKIEPEKIETETGGIMSKARKELGLSTARLAELSRIPQYQIEALEDGFFEKLPPPTYIKGIVRRLEKVLKIDEGKLFEAYNSERSIPENLSLPKIFDDKRSKVFVKVAITPRKLVLAAGSLLLVFILGYIWYQYDYLVGPPSLAVLNPDRDLATQDQNLEIKGRADYDSDLTINGESIYVNNDGAFSKKIDLVFGLNVIEVQAKNKYGKSSTIIRKVLFNGTEINAAAVGTTTLKEIKN